MSAAAVRKRSDRCWAAMLSPATGRQAVNEVSMVEWWWIKKNSFHSLCRSLDSARRRSRWMFSDACPSRMVNDFNGLKPAQPARARKDEESTAYGCIHVGQTRSSWVCISQQGLSRLTSTRALLELLRCYQFLILLFSPLMNFFFLLHSSSFSPPHPFAHHITMFFLTTVRRTHKRWGDVVHSKDY